MIPYGRHSINDEDIEAVVKALKSDWLTTGPLVEEFESELEKIVGAPCISVSSGTAALHCAYAAIDLKPGDEVITVAAGFPTTVTPILQNGLVPVYVDVDPETYVAINEQMVRRTVQNAFQGTIGGQKQAFVFNRVVDLPFIHDDRLNNIITYNIIFIFVYY